MTVLGQHTVNETRDLIRSLEFRINKGIQQLQRVQAQRFSPPTAEQQQLDKDMGTFVRNWTDVRDRETLDMADRVVLNALVSPDALPAENNFVAIDTAASRNPNTDLRLITITNKVDREAAALGLPPTDLSQIPAQDSPDADFAALKKLDSAIAAGGNPLGKPGGTDSVATSPLGLILIGGAILAAGVGALYVRKVFL